MNNRFDFMGNDVVPCEFFLEELELDEVWEHHEKYHNQLDDES